MDQLLADIYGLALTVHQDSKSGGAMGAARLAWLATGGDLDTVCVTPPVAAEPALHRFPEAVIRVTHCVSLVQLR